MRTSGGVVFAVSLLAATAIGGPANAADKIKIGVFSTLEGTYTALGEDGMRGFDLAVMQHHNKAGGKELEIIRGSSDASPELGYSRREEAGRAGQGRYPDRPAFGRGRHCVA